MKLKSINPEEMTNSEILSVCTELQTAKNWGFDHGQVVMEDNQCVDIPVSRHKEYQDAYQVITGGL